MRFFNIKKCDCLQNIEMIDDIIVAPNGAIFCIPHDTQGAYDVQERRYGMHKAYQLSDGKMFPDTETHCLFDQGHLIHLTQYKRIDGFMIKCLDCDIHNEQVIGAFYCVANGEKYEGVVSSGGLFTGSCQTPTSSKWYLNGLRHGKQKEQMRRDGEWVDIQKTYHHGYLDGEFSVSGKSIYQYGYIKNGEVIFEKEITFNQYPILQKMSLVGILGALVTYGERQVLRHTASQQKQNNHER